MPVQNLSAEAAQALGAGGVSAVLIHSPRGAETFLALAREAGLGERLASLAFIAISEAAAEPLRAAGLGDVVVAALPNEDALLEALAERRARRDHQTR